MNKKIRSLQASPLLHGTPSSFYAFSSHFEEVGLLPKELLNLAQSQDCAIQAVQHQRLPAFGVQFHPERSPTEAKKILKESIAMGHPKVLLHPHRTDDLYDPNIGETVFKNFLQMNI